MKEKIAKIVRVITVPPILATAMLVILYRSFGKEFASTAEMIMGILCLAVLPACAYPIAGAKKSQPDARENQRRVAFILNFAGYLAALLLGIILKYPKMLLSVFWAYFIAVLILIFVNKETHLRASGHAASCVLPYLVLSYWMGGWSGLLCICLYGIEFWASVELKRHTAQEFLVGSLAAVGAFGCVWVAFGFI